MPSPPSRPKTEEGRVRLEGRADSLALETRMTAPVDTGLADMAAALRRGFAVEARLVFGPGESRTVVTDEGETRARHEPQRGLGLEMALSDDGLVTAFESAGAAGRIDGGDLPFPVAYEAERPPRASPCRSRATTRRSPSSCRWTSRRSP